MVAGLQLPDVMASVLTLLRADPDVSALCAQNQPSGQPPRVAISFPESSDPARLWKMPDYAVLVRRSGGPAANLDIGERFARLDVICYGSGATLGIRRRTADQLWRTVDPVLCPPPGRAASFRLAHTEVFWVYPESEPIPSIEPGTDWPRVVTPYVLVYASNKLP